MTKIAVRFDEGTVYCLAPWLAIVVIRGSEFTVRVGRRYITRHAWRDASGRRAKWHTWRKP